MVCNVHRTYNGMREQLAEPNFLVPRKTNNAAPVFHAPSKPKMCRTLPTQTDDPPSKKCQGTQTEEERNAAVPPAVPANNVVVHVPTVVEDSLPSPSALVVQHGPSANESIEPTPAIVLPTLENERVETQSIRSGFSDWGEVCDRRLAVRNMLREYDREALPSEQSRRRGNDSPTIRHDGCFAQTTPRSKPASVFTDESTTPSCQT